MKQSDSAWDDWVNKGIREAQARLVYFKYWKDATEESFKEWHNELLKVIDYK